MKLKYRTSSEVDQRKAVCVADETEVHHLWLNDQGGKGPEPLEPEQNSPKLSLTGQSVAKRSGLQHNDHTEQNRTCEIAVHDITKSGSGKSDPEQNVTPFKTIYLCVCHNSCLSEEPKGSSACTGIALIITKKTSRK